MKDMTVGKESRLIWRFALPMLIGNVFQQLYNVIDSIIVGKFINTEWVNSYINPFLFLGVLIVGYFKIFGKLLKGKKK